MATNFYLDHYANRREQSLVEDLTIESIKMYGVDVIYIPRDVIERDNIFGEDIVTKYGSNYMIEMYLDSIDGFDGNGDILAKFGLQVTDQADLIVARKRFNQIISGRARPMEGDLIYFPLSHSMFEINHVKHENPFYQMGSLYTYKLSVELFTYSHEEFNTGIEAIDSINVDHSNEAKLDAADNFDIQLEADDVVVRDGDDQGYTTVNDDSMFDPDDPFGDTL